jgi:hypothetical protein
VKIGELLIEESGATELFKKLAADLRAVIKRHFPRGDLLIGSQIAARIYENVIEASSKGEIDLLDDPDVLFHELYDTDLHHAGDHFIYNLHADPGSLDHHDRRGEIPTEPSSEDEDEDDVIERQQNKLRDLAHDLVTAIKRVAPTIKKNWKRYKTEGGEELKRSGSRFIDYEKL